MEESCWQFCSNKLMNVSDVSKRQTYEKYRPIGATKGVVRGGYHGGGDTLRSTRPNYNQWYNPLPANGYYGNQSSYFGKCNREEYGRQTPPYYSKRDVYCRRQCQQLEFQSGHHPNRVSRRLDLGGQDTKGPSAQIDAYYTKSYRSLKHSNGFENGRCIHQPHAQFKDVAKYTTIKPKTSVLPRNSGCSSRIEVPEHGPSVNPAVLNDVLHNPEIASLAERADNDFVTSTYKCGSLDPTVRAIVDVIKQNTNNNYLPPGVPHYPFAQQNGTGNVNVKGDINDAWNFMKDILRLESKLSQTNTPQSECFQKSEDPKAKSPKAKPLCPDELIIPEFDLCDLKPEYNDNGSVVYLGEGVHGYVAKATLVDKERGETFDVAAKYFRPEMNTEQQVLQEAQIQKYLEGTGVVPKVFGLVKMENKESLPILIQERIGGGKTVYDRLLDGAPKLTWLKFCLEVSKGLKKIHEKGVLLNDIKFDNILLEEQGQTIGVRFIDFGLSTHNATLVLDAPENETKDSHHIAPEVIKHQPSTILSDIYSLGYVIKYIGREIKEPFVESLAKMLTCVEARKRTPLDEFIPFLHSLVRKEENAAQL